MINGKNYDFPMFSKEEIAIAEENGFVIVYGMSDDLIEFEGSIYDEYGCYDGGDVWFNSDGVVDEPATTTDRWIKAFWCDDNAKDENCGLITWSYQTDIPHEDFMIYDDDEPYCRGIVFSINDVMKHQDEYCPICGHIKEQCECENQ